MSEIMPGQPKKQELPRMSEEDLAFLIEEQRKVTEVRLSESLARLRLEAEEIAQRALESQSVPQGTEGIKGKDVHHDRDAVSSLSTPLDDQPVRSLRRRGAGRAVPSDAQSIATPPASENMSPSPAGAALDTLLAQAQSQGTEDESAQKEAVPQDTKTETKEVPIVEGLYKDHEGMLCNITNTNGVYSYTYLEGAEKGNTFMQPSVQKMRHLIADDWQKVPDDTRPQEEVPEATPPIQNSSDSVLINNPDTLSNADKKQEQEPTRWTQKRLFATINDGDTFVVVDKNGKETEYQRKGSKITKTKGGVAREQKADVVVMLNQGGHIKGSETPVAPVAVSSDVAAAVEVPVADTAFTPGSFLEGKSFLVYTNKDGKLVKVERHGDEYAVFGGAHNLHKTASEEEIRKWSEEEGWKVKESTLPVERREVLKPFLPEEGKIYRFQSKKVPGNNSVVRRSDGYHFFNTSGKEFTHLIERELETSTATLAEQEAWMRETAKREGWWLVSIDNVPQDEAVASAFDSESGIGANEVAPPDVQNKNQSVKGASPDSALGAPIDIDLTIAAPAVSDTAVSQGERKERKIGFEPLAEGAKASYISKKYGTERTVLRKGNVYYYTRGKDLSDVLRMNMAVSEKQIQEIALFEEWVALDPGMSTDVELPGASLRSGEKSEVGVFRPLAPGSTALYTTLLGKEIRVERDPVGDSYILFYPGKEPVPLDLAGVEAVALREGWKYREVPVTSPKPENVPDTRKLDELQALVDAERLAFVTMDYKQTSAWQRMKDFFGSNITKESRSQDTESARQRYTEALNRLQDAQLAQLKTSGLEGQELRDRMAQMLHYYKYDERVNLFNYRNQVKIEHKNLPQRAISALEKIGRAYNALSPKKKLAIGGVFLVTGAGAMIVGAGGLTAAMSGAALIKRLITTSGLAVTVDVGVEKWQEKRRFNKSEEEKSGNLDEIGTVYENTKGEEHFNRLESILKRDIESLDQKFQSQKKQALYRRSAVFGTAVLGMAGMGAAYASHISGASALRPDISDQSTRQVARMARGAASAVSSPDHAASGTPLSESVANLPDTEASGAGTATETVRPGVSVDQVRAAAPAVAEAPGVSALREVYTVSGDDGKKGLWGVLERRLPADFSGDKNRAIASLQNAMRAKLDAMTPAERIKVGFSGTLPDGKVNLDLIRPKDQIDFGKLLTPKEIQSVLEGKAIASPRAVEAVAKVARAGATLSTKPSLDMFDQLKGGSGALSRAAAHIADPNYTGQQPVSGVRGVVAASVSTPTPTPASGVTVIERPTVTVIEPPTTTEYPPRAMTYREKLARGLVRPESQYDDPRLRGRMTYRALTENRGVRYPFDIQRAPVSGVRSGVSAVRGVLETNNQAVLENITLTDPKAYLLEHPEDLGRYNNTLGRLRMGIFMMNPAGEGVVSQAYDYTVNGEKLGGTSVSRVLKDMNGFQSGRLSYDRLRNPLHYDQMKELVKFVEACNKTLGPQFAQVEVGEDINHYTQRMATAALRTGKNIPGFFKQ